MSSALLHLDNLSKNYGALRVTDHVSLTVHPREIHALIGPNGAGKTTLTAQISGLLQPDSGRVFFLDQDVSALDVAARSRLGLGRSFQITSVFPSMTALENVSIAVRAHQGHCFHFWRAASKDLSIQEKALGLLDRVGLTELAHKRAEILAHGDLRLLELAIALAPAPKLLVLDEPMAGLGAYESQEMVVLLSELKKKHGILLIEHDMDAVFKLADRISVLVSGKIICTGTAEEIRNNAAVKEAYLGEEDA